METDPRLQLAYLAAQQEQRKPPLLDVALTHGEVVRFKKHSSDPYVRYFHERRVTQDPLRKLSMAQQSRFKYVLYVDGNVAAYRLSALFAMASVVICVAGDYQVWFQPLLKHMHNCIIVQRTEDVPAMVAWCRDHDAQCKQIAREGLRLYRTLFCKEGLLDYGHLLLSAVADVNLVK